MSRASDPRPAAAGPVDAKVDLGRRPIRLAMFPMMTAKNAATRLFCYQWVTPLIGHRIIAAVYPPSSIRMYERLCERPSSCLTLPCKALYWYAIVPLTRIAQLVAAA